MMKNLVLFIVLVFGGIHESAAMANTLTNPASPLYLGGQDDKPVHKEFTCTKVGDNDYSCSEKIHKIEEEDNFPLPIKIFMGLIVVAAAWFSTRK